MAILTRDLKCTLNMEEDARHWSQVVKTQDLDLTKSTNQVSTTKTALEWQTRKGRSITALLLAIKHYLTLWAALRHWAINK